MKNRNRDARTNRSWWRLIALPLVLALGAAACGDDGESDGASSETTTSPETTEEAVENITVRAAPVNYIVSALPFFYADAMGYFEDEGITMEMTEPTGNSTVGIQLVRSGDVDLTFTGGAALLAAVEAGVPVVASGNISMGTSQQLILGTEAAERLEDSGVTPDSSIEDRVTALEGLTIATGAEGTGTNLYLRGALEEFDMDPDSDVTIQPVPNAPAILAAVREGHADAFVWSPPETSIPVVEGWGTQWIRFSDGEVEGLTGDIGLPLVSTRSWAEDNSEALTRIWRALLRAQEELSQDELPDLSRVKERYFKDLDQAVFEGAVNDVQVMFESAVPTEELFQASKDQHDVTAAAPTDLTIEEVFILDPLEDAES